MNYPLFLLFGFVPSLIWLAFYLRKDAHPEPNSVIQKVFLLGMLATLPAIALELGLRSLFSFLPFSEGVILILYIFLGVALVEEILKFLVVRFAVYKDKALDEPVDVMLYMIIAALGFAAFENILILFGLGASSPISSILALTLVRLVGATFLHALASGTFGYFLARSFLDKKRKYLYVAAGLFVATLLHGLFNFYILEVQGAAKLVVPAIILIGLAIFVSMSFKQLQKIIKLRP
ncbi:PrsW family intramembrane metalloprotease [Patescibacteria group bacterium]|nr:PrsW family intramembrane metalloprotease [Patescibacteria group bacterium]